MLALSMRPGYYDKVLVALDSSVDMLLMTARVRNDNDLIFRKALKTRGPGADT